MNKDLMESSKFIMIKYAMFKDRCLKDYKNIISRERFTVDNLSKQVTDACIAVAFRLTNIKDFIMLKEEWREIKGFPKYEVSNLGRVRSYYTQNGAKSPHIIKAYPQPLHLSVTLCNKGIKLQGRIHRLVADAFLGERPSGCETSHIDENCLNNFANNLCYESHADNNRRPLRLMRSSFSRPISKSGFRGVKVRKDGYISASIAVKCKYVHLGYYKTAQEAAKAYDKKAIELLGKYAVTNKMLGLLNE